MVWLACVPALLPLAFWWRFRRTPLDRDYAPYCYPAVLGVPYLREGHCEIKPPLAHFVFKLWVGAARGLGFKAGPMLLRSPSAFTLSACVALVGVHWGLPQAWVLAVLACSPTLWPHMANTEWLTVGLLCAAAGLAGAWPGAAWGLLGALPWVNQKNALLVPVAAYALGLPLEPWPMTLAGLILPSLLLLGYLVLTGRLALFVHWCWTMPARFGRKRTFKQNVVGASPMTLPCLYLCAPVLAVMEWRSPWALMALAVLAVMLWSRQVVPHHLMLMALPLALAARPGPMMWVALGAVWVLRDGRLWWRPEGIYQVTCSPDFDALVRDAVAVEEHLRDNTPQDTVVWVNGMENQIYINARRRAWRIEIPELEGHPEGDPPAVVVHCHGSAKPFDYDAHGYRIVGQSPQNRYTVLMRP